MTGVIIITFVNSTPSEDNKCSFFIYLILSYYLFIDFPDYENSDCNNIGY